MPSSYALDDLRALEPGDALFDLTGSGSLSFPGGGGLTKSFNPLAFMNLCVGLEAAVLHERLFVVGPDPHEAIFPVVLDNAVAQLLYKERVLHFIPGTPSLTTALMEESKGWWEINDTLSRTGAFVEDRLTKPLDLFRRFLRLRTTVAIEELFGIPSVYSLESLPVYCSASGFRRDQRVISAVRASLAEKYRDFRELLQGIRRDLGSEETVMLPPIALEILTGAANLDDLGESLLRVRSKYSGLRAKFRELDELFRSKDVSPLAKLKERTRLQKSIDALFSKQEMASAVAKGDPMQLLTGFAHGINDTIKLNQLDDGVDWSDLNYNKIVPLLLGRLEAMYWRFQLRPLHATKLTYPRWTPQNRPYVDG